jgi:hypothetical protein
MLQPEQLSAPRHASAPEFNQRGEESSRQEDTGKITGCTGMWLQAVSENSILVIFLTSISIEKCSSYQLDCALSQHS